MKKVVALFMAVFMLVSVTAYGADLTFLSEPYKNYASEGTLKIKFDDSGNFEKLLNEMGAAEESGQVIDLVPFIKSLLTFEGNGKTQVNMSDNYKKLDAAFVFDTSQYISVNPNLNADVRAKYGFWIEMDLSDSKNPVYNMILSTPFMKKYMVIDLSELIGEEEKDSFITAVDSMLNEDFVKEQNEFMMKVIEENAHAELSKDKCVIKIDNESFIAIVKELFLFSADMTRNGYIPEEEKESFDEAMRQLNEIDFSDIKVLGKDGIVITYGLKNGRITSLDITADISINIAELYNRFTGEEWEYTSEGLLEFDVEISEKITSKDIDVVFPELTEENSVLLHEMYDDSWYEPEYPRYSVYADCNYLPIIDGEVYVPLRQTIDEAYGDTAHISYEKGNITLSSENFKDFSTLSLTVGSDKARSDTGEYTIKPPVVHDGVSYVAASFFEDVFSWEYGGANKDVLNNRYYYDFYTYTYDESYDSVDYPGYFVCGYSEDIKIIDGEVYMPLRQVFENAYGDSVSITFEKGAIKLESEYFQGFKTLTLINGSDKAYTENSEYSIGNVFIENGTTYVNKSLFEDVFGWKLSALSYYIENNDWSYDFVTVQE